MNESILPERVSTRTPDREGPGLLIRLNPRRLFILASDADQEREVEPLARAVNALLDLIDEQEVAA